MTISTDFCKQPNTGKMVPLASSIRRAVCRPNKFFDRKFIRNKVSQDKIWFVDIPRTSSTFVRANLGRSLGYPHGKQNIPNNEEFETRISNYLPSHTPAHRVREFLGSNLWEQTESFSIVREPVEWSVSFWGYRRRYKNFSGTYMDFLKMLGANLAVPYSSRPRTPYHCLQSDYLVEPVEGKFIVNRIFRFDQRENIARYLKSITGRENPISKKLMQSEVKNYKPTREELLFAYKILEQDFDLLNSYY